LIVTGFVLPDEKVCPPSPPPKSTLFLITLPRQPYDQWHEALERSRDDARTSGRDLESREAEKCSQDRTDAFEGCLVRPMAPRPTPHLKRLTNRRIPFERALSLANQEKITEQLYPLFVHNIASLLYHPINAARPGPLPPVQHQEGPLPRLENMGDPLPRPQNLQFVDDPDRLPRL